MTPTTATMCEHAASRCAAMITLGDRATGLRWRLCLLLLRTGRAARA